MVILPLAPLARKSRAFTIMPHSYVLPITPARLQRKFFDADCRDALGYQEAARRRDGSGGGAGIATTGGCSLCAAASCRIRVFTLSWNASM
jgi:hypothetical protein